MKKLLLSILNRMFLNTLYAKHTFCNNVLSFIGYDETIKELIPEEPHTAKFQVNNWAVITIYMKENHYITKIDVTSVK